VESRLPPQRRLHRVSMKTLMCLPILVAVGLLVVKSCVLPYWYKPPRVVVGFRVLDHRTGKPIDGATFRVWGKGEDYFHRVGTDGTLMNVIRGATPDWRFKVSADGYESAEGTLGSVLRAPFFEGKATGPPTIVRLKQTTP
jgi:hypothetical protein